MSKVFQTMAASLRHAAWTNKAAIIGGGVYNRDECSAAAEALETFPAMLAALRNLLPMWSSGIDEPWVRDARAILSRIDGAPTAQPAGLWRIVSGDPDTPRALYWNNRDGWGGLAESDGFSQAERETLNLPIGGRWWFDSDDEPAAPSGEAARPTYAELANAARDAAEWFASGGEVGGCLLDDSEMAGRFAGLVAAMDGEG